MKRYKIGIIFIASIIAIASIGVGLSFWSDSISIFGTITTGNVSHNVINYSGTWVYEDLVTGDCIVSDVELENESLNLISYSKATPGNENYDASIIFENLFPSILFQSNITIKYTGSIPGKIYNISYIYNSSNNWIDDLILSGDIYTTIKDSSGNNITIGQTLHKNDLIDACFLIHIPYDQGLMNFSGFFSAKIDILQWNEYKPPSGNVQPQNETPLDISNYVIDQMSSEKRYVISENITIKPKDYVIIARDSNQTGFEEFWGVSFSSNVIFIDSNNLFTSINGDETFILRNNTNITIDEAIGQPLITYHTIERINTTDDPTLPSSWNISTDNYATPGYSAVGSGTAGLIINEYSDVSGTGNWKYEFIELYYDL